MDSENPGGCGGAGIARVERRGAPRDVRARPWLPRSRPPRGPRKERDGDRQRHPAWADPDRSVRPALHVSSPRPAPALSCRLGGTAHSYLTAAGPLRQSCKSALPGAQAPGVPETLEHQSVRERGRFPQAGRIAPSFPAPSYRNSQPRRYLISSPAFGVGRVKMKRLSLPLAAVIALLAVPGSALAASARPLSHVDTGLSRSLHGDAGRQPHPLRRALHGPHHAARTALPGRAHRSSRSPTSSPAARMGCWAWLSVRTTPRTVAYGRT